MDGRPKHTKRKIYVYERKRIRVVGALTVSNVIFSPSMQTPDYEDKSADNLLYERLVPFTNYN